MSIIPSSHSDLLDARTIWHIATKGPDGTLQSTPVWGGWDGEHFVFSVTTGRQKYRNLQAEPDIAVSGTDPENPYRYLEIRGRVVRFDDDSSNTFIDSMAKKRTRRSQIGRVPAERGHRHLPDHAGVGDGRARRRVVGSDVAIGRRANTPEPVGFGARRGRDAVRGRRRRRRARRAPGRRVLATTFTASQGLLLMLPNMFKIAGELTPFCLHVAARSVATHALSIFGDHSDVMAPGARASRCSPRDRPGGAGPRGDRPRRHAASRVPFLHFFDGFRTSHEIQKKVDVVDDDVLTALIDDEATLPPTASARLTPDRPGGARHGAEPRHVLPGREAANPFHDAVSRRRRGHDGPLRRAHRPPLRTFDYVGTPRPSGSS
jgi:PPOX class probable F420-dependent enzyme